MATMFRFDPEYFKQVHLADVTHIETQAKRFVLFSDLHLAVDASAFYPAIEDFYGKGDLPFLRVADVDAVIDYSECTTIPAKLCTQYPTLQRVHPGDIVFTKGGSVARIGLVRQDAAVSRDLIFLNTSKLDPNDRTFLYLYFQTSFFNRLLVRSSSQTAQPHLTITLVRDLPVLTSGDELKRKCAEIVTQAHNNRDAAIAGLRQAEQSLLCALGLEAWKPLEPLTYTRRASDVFAAGRFDAEHYQPRYRALLEHLDRNAKRCRHVEEFAVHCDRGAQPQYFDDGPLAVITSKHILETGLDYDNFDRTKADYWDNPDFESARIRTKDILTYTTGAKVGRTACYLAEDRALASNHVNLVRVEGENPLYVAAVMNSMIGRMQTRMLVSGSAQVELYPGDIRRFLIPFVDEKTETAIAEAVQESYAARKRAHALLERAKRAVEIAIEESEKDALAFLGQP